MSTLWSLMLQQGSVGAQGASGAAGIDGFTCGGRLTLLTGTPIPTTDLTGIGTLYFTPYLSTFVSLYNGSSWVRTTFAEVALTLSLTSGKPYDIFLYSNSGTLTLEAVVWTSNTARATALDLQDGVYVKNGAHTHLYVGTIYASGTNTCEDSAANRYVWNCYNRVAKPLRKFESTTSWTYATASWRAANNSSANAVAIVTGLACDVHVEARAMNGGTTANTNTRGIGISKGSPASGTSNDADSWGTNNSGSVALQLEASVDEIAAPGYHNYIWVEYGGATSANATFYGTVAVGNIGAGVGGITGIHWC